MEQYNVKGMSCAACSARVERAVRAVPGVTDCAVSLLTNSMTVEGGSPAAVISAVKKAGYGASLCKGNAGGVTDETPQMVRRLAVSVVLLLVLMYISMGHMMWGWPLPAPVAESMEWQGLMQAVLTLAIMIVNRKFFVSGVRGVLHGAPNMDTLVALGAGASFAYSLCILVLMALGKPLRSHDFYFESAAMILTLITLGKLLEARSKGKTTDALRALMKLSPKTATVLRDGAEVKVGDEFVVRPGESIPVDGEVLDGSCAVDESALTGESLPADKAAGDLLSAATINLSGFAHCRATRVGEDTTFSKIIRMVEGAAASKAPIAKAADRVAGVFVPAVMGIAAVTFIVWLLCGETLGFALARGVTVLVISCPCALGLATPVAIMVGSGVGAKNNILFKTAAALEAAGRVKIVALDKTGTVTAGKPSVTDILPADGTDADALLSAALALEQKSEHPLSLAILRDAGEKGITAAAVENFTALPGNGLRGTREAETLIGGNAAFVGATAAIPAEMRTAAEKLAGEGKTPIFFAADTKLLGIIAVADTVAPGSAEAIARMKHMGLRVVMLTGDNARTAAAVAETAGIISGSPFFQFGNKEGVLLDLVQKMFHGQFATAGDLAGTTADPLLIYAMETALQLHIAEMSDELRELYVTAYTLPRTAAYIYESMIDKIEAFFAPYLPGAEKNDFYELEIAAAGVMRGFMARHCDLYFTIERKTERCLSCCFKLYEVPREAYMPVLEKVLTLDLASIAKRMVEKTLEDAEVDVEAALAEPRVPRKARKKSEEEN